MELLLGDNNLEEEKFQNGIFYLCEDSPKYSSQKSDRSGLKYQNPIAKGSHSDEPFFKEV